MKGNYFVGFLISVLLFGTIAAASQTFAQTAPNFIPGSGEVVGVFGKIPGKDLIVHVWVVVPPGADKNEVAREALGQQGARPWAHDEFSTTGLVWDQFSDADAGNDFVTQYYNSNDDPTEGGGGELALLSTHSTWDAPTTSTFDFFYGGTTDRCPSLVRECKGPQFFDGFNDVAWLELRGCCTLGVTWFGTSIDEADMALNLDFDWFTDGVEHFDVETVFLHENGHVVGLGHSDVLQAVMYPSYQGVRQDLHQDDIDGITSLYPAGGGGDITAPDTSIDSANDGSGADVANGGTTSSSSITFTFSGTDNVLVAGFECSLDAAAFSACTSPKSYSSLSDGSHNFQVSAIDTSNNVDPSPASFTWTVDTTVPLALSVTVSTDAPSYVDGDNVFITVLVTDGTNPVEGVSVHVELTTANGSILSGDGITDANGVTLFRYTVNTDLHGIGTYSLSATASKTGYVTGTGSSTFEVTPPPDTTPPTVTITVSDALITDADVGPNNFQVIATFSEAMDTSVIPSITFTPDVGTTLSFASGAFSAGNTVYTANYNVVDANVQVTGVDVSVGGAKDVAGNFQSPNPTTTADLFNIDTENPPAPDTADVTVTEVEAKSINVGRNYRIASVIQNEDLNQPVTITVRATVENNADATISEVLSPQTITIDAESDFEIEFNDASTLPAGSYTVTITVQEDPNVGPNNSASFNIRSAEKGGD